MPQAPSSGLVLAVLLAGGFMPPVDFFIVNVGLPSIKGSLDATPAEVQLVISGYAAGYAVFLITGGRLGDLFGRRTCYLWGMAFFALTNLACGLAPARGCWWWRRAWPPPCCCRKSSPRSAPCTRTSAR